MRRGIDVEEFRGFVYRLEMEIRERIRIFFSLNKLVLGSVSYWNG